MLTLFLLTIIIVFLGFHYNVYAKRYRDINNLPGPSLFQLAKELLIGNSSEGIISYLHGLPEKYGPIVKVWAKPFKPIIVTTDMELCNRIFKASDHHITPSFDMLTLLGDGIARNPDYNIWRKDKQLIMRSITQEYIADRLKMYDRNYDDLLNTIRRNLGKAIDMQELLYCALIKIMVATLNDPNVDLDQQEINDYIQYRKDFFDLLFVRMNSVRMFGLLYKLTENYRLSTKCTDEIRGFAKTWLGRHKRIKEESRERHNLIYAMLDGGMPEDRIADNINNIIQGGHDSSVWPLSMTFQEMSKRPEIQEKILEEIFHVMGTDITAEVTLDHLDRMPYLHALVKESLRMYFPAPFLDRRLLYDMTINNLRIPKDTVIMFDVPGILRSEENYEDPAIFRPERFLKENATARGRKAFISFSYGLKICPGKDIAYAAMKLLIVKIIREFEIVPLQEEHEPRMVAELFFRNTNGIPIAFQKRPLQ